MFDQTKAQAAIHQIHEGLQALSQTFDQEDTDGWLSWPPVALDMMLIANVRLQAIQQMGVALEENPLFIPDLECEPRMYLIDAEGGLFVMILPGDSDHDEEFELVFDGLMTEINKSTRDYELWILDDTDTRMIELPGTGTRLADDLFETETITED
ncbi:MAG: hypothetical protein GY832_35745 [Chloroflexi bacterium]|nr:hypothetical protein [Chloroflexota bacterium]